MPERDEAEHQAQSRPRDAPGTGERAGHAVGQPELPAWSPARASAGETDEGVPTKSGWAVTPATTSDADADEDADDDEAGEFGTPGKPISRHSAFYKGFWGAIGVLIAVALALAIREMQSIILIVLASIFLAVGLNPVVEWLTRRRIARRWAVLIVTLGVLGIVTLFVVSLVPVLRDQITTLIDHAPGYLDALRKNRTVHSLDTKYNVISTIDEKLKDPALAQQAFGSIFSVGLAVLSALLNAFIVFVLTLYFLSALPQIKQACYSLAPASRRTRVASLGDEILRRVGGYVAGAFI
ncbi:MAG: AI-2E family transporter, partial [Gaiellaceae bacterium]